MPFRTLLPFFILLAVAPLALSDPAGLAQKLVEELGLRTTTTEKWVKPEKVLVFLPPARIGGADDLRAGFVQAAEGFEVALHFADWGQPSPHLADADVLFGVCDPGMLESAPRIRYLHHYFAGLDRCSFNDEVVARELVLTNGQGVAAPTMAEHVLAMMLTLSRNLHQYRDHQAEGRWTRADGPRSIALHGRTVLILGLGGIGREVARRAHALGMRVIATRNSSREGPDYVARVGLASETLELAREADFVVNALPLTRATDGSIGKAFFAALPAGSYYINVGRGGTTVTDDLLAALQDGTLAGAGLDVTDPEPLQSDHPLWQQSNVIITPHTATASALSDRYRWIIARDNLRRYLANEPLINRAYLDRGY